MILSTPLEHRQFENQRKGNREECGVGRKQERMIEGSREEGRSGGGKQERRIERGK